MGPSLRHTERGLLPTITRGGGAREQGCIASSVVGGKLWEACRTATTSLM